MAKLTRTQEELIELLPRLKRFAFALARNGVDADDLLQSTIERLLVKNAPEGADLSRWSFRVCKNIWIDEIRSRAVRSAAPIDDRYDIAGDDGESIALSRLKLEETRAAMERLSDDQRATLLLVAVEGLSYREAADTLGVPIGTIMSRLGRARRALADAFAEGGETVGID